MKVSVLGLGLGFSFCQYLAYRGYTVTGVDIDAGAYTNPRLDDEMRLWLEDHKRPVFYTTDFRYAEDSEIAFCFVSTPIKDGRLWAGNVRSALSSLAEAGFSGTTAVLSTLPIGTMASLHESFPKMKIIYCPPMVKKQRFLSTFIDPPSRWQLFSKDDRALRELYGGLQKAWVRQIVAPEGVIEKAKLLTNMMLATKIIMANAAASAFGEEGKRACEIVRLDPRVGEGYFTPGGPAAGPCLPRDMMELEAASEDIMESHLYEILHYLNLANGTAGLT